MQRSRGIAKGEVLLIVGLALVGGIILWFVASRTRERLVTQNCATNVRELGMALTEYSYDHDGSPPPFTNLEAVLAKQNGSKTLPTNSSAPEELKVCLHIYTDDPAWFCPADVFAQQSKYYLGIRHETTSYAFPSYRNSKGGVLSLNQIPTSEKNPLLWDASGNRQSCEADLWRAGSREWASNHPDGYSNVILADLSLHHLPAEEVGKLVP